MRTGTVNSGFWYALLAAALLGVMPLQAGFADPITAEIRRQQALQRYNAGMSNAYRQSTQRASQPQSGYAPSNQAMESQYRTAMYYVQRGEFNLAAKRFEQMVRLRPWDGEALFQLGLCYEAMGNIPQAVEKFSAVAVNHARYSEAQAKVAALAGLAPAAVAPQRDPRFSASPYGAPANSYQTPSPYQQAPPSTIPPARGYSGGYPVQTSAVPPVQVVPQAPAAAPTPLTQTTVQVPAQAVTQSSVTDSGKPVNRPIKDKWALIIGISNFADSQINLQYSAKDALDFKDYLIKSANFAPSHVRTLIDKEATRDRIFDEFGDSWLPRVAGRDDLVVIYISTHGTPADADDIGHVNYLVAYDTDKTKLFSKGIAMQELCGLIKSRVKSDRVLIVLDTCFSGNTVATGKGLIRTGNVSADEIALGTGQLVICSSSTSQRSWESKQYPNGIFTKKLIESLQINGSKTTLGQAFAALKDKVEDEARRQYAVTQTPCMNGKWSGNDLILAVPPSEPKPGL
jgi:tetratricopeptide (TPR) repeat protein